ncbi:MAG TPA: M48 family metalloprotease [Kiritimatiellia bacterium]|nr:M48 family metalloprotease [Kiritimatiellia bacterium]
MNSTLKRWMLGLLGVAGAAGLGLSTGCSTVAQGVATVGQATGTVTPEQAQAIVRSAEAIERSFEDFTPEQEYFLGRAVGASIVHRYGVYDNPMATRYLNLLGQSLALFSDKPETYRGYSFLILDTDEINAFAAPSGFIFISRGMIRLCRNEEELAAVLAHEIGHVQHAHALRAIRTSRITSAFTILGTEAAKNLGGAELAQLTETFSGSIDDMTQTLITSGYSRGQEREADRAAVTILQRAGYDPRGLISMLEAMDQGLKPGGLDFAKTHPPPQARIRDVNRMIDGTGPSPEAIERRAARFARYMSGI